MSCEKNNTYPNLRNTVEPHLSRSERNVDCGENLRVYTGDYITNRYTNVHPMNPMFLDINVPWSVQHAPQGGVYSRLQNRNVNEVGASGVSNEYLNININHQQSQILGTNIQPLNVNVDDKHELNEISNETLNKCGGLEAVELNTISFNPQPHPGNLDGTERTSAPATGSNEIVYNKEAGTNTMNTIQLPIEINCNVQGDVQRHQDSSYLDDKVFSDDILGSDFENIAQLDTDLFKNMMEQFSEDQGPIQTSVRTTDGAMVMNTKGSVQNVQSKGEKHVEQADDISKALSMPSTVKKEPNSNNRQGNTQAEANMSATKKGVKRKPRTYSQAVPSQHCHICSRKPSAESPHVVCGNLKIGQCRKTVCAKCFVQFKWNLAEAMNAAPGAWKCPHCREECPSRAQCVIYNRTSNRRRNKTISHRKRKGGDNGTNADVNNRAPKRTKVESNGTVQAVERPNSNGKVKQAQPAIQGLPKPIPAVGNDTDSQSVSFVGETNVDLTLQRSQQNVPRGGSSSRVNIQVPRTQVAGPVSAQNIIDTLKASSYIVGTPQQKEVLWNIIQERMEEDYKQVSNNANFIPMMNSEIRALRQAQSVNSGAFSTISASQGTKSSHQKYRVRNAMGESRQRDTTSDGIVSNVQKNRTNIGHPSDDYLAQLRIESNQEMERSQAPTINCSNLNATGNEQPLEQQGNSFDIDNDSISSWLKDNPNLLEPTQGFSADEDLNFDSFLD